MIDYKNLSDESLYEISLQKDKKGFYTKEVNDAYAERRRRSGLIKYGGVSSKCNKWQCDFDYNGNYGD